MDEQNAPAVEIGPRPPRLSGPEGLTLARALGSVRESALLSDADGTICFANQAAAILFGTSHLPGRSVVDLVGGVGAAEAAALERVLGEGRDWEGSLTRVGPDGRHFITSARVSALVTDAQPLRLWLERAEAGRDANEAETRLALSLAAGRMAVWDYDPAADRVVGSPDLFRLMGFPPGAEPSMEEIRARYYPGERERLAAEGAAAMARGERFVESEFRYLRPDGSVCWVLLRAEAVRGTGGRPVRALGIAMDVTDRKRAEEDLRASEAHLRLAQGAAGIGAWDWNPRAGTLTASPDVARITGWPFGGHGPSSLAALLRAIHPGDRRPAVAALRDALRHARPFALDFRFGNAAARWLRVHGTPVRDRDAARFVGIVADVSDEHRREERLLVLADGLRGAAVRAEREREHIYDLSNDLFAAVEDGRVTAQNPAWARLLGRDVRGAPFLELIDPADRVQAAATLATASSGALCRVEARLDMGDGGTAWIAWAFAAEGNTLYAVGRDVTLDKAREASLTQSQKMQALGQLTGGIAHDFNNILQAVSGYLELIRRQPGDAIRVRSWAETAQLASERGRKLTEQLLSFSRSEQVDVETIALSDVLSGLRDLFERTLGRAARVHVALPEPPLGVHANRAQFETALMNLAVNARDAMPEGGEVTFAVEAVTLADDLDLPAGEYVAVRVSDTGMGMPEDVVKRAFDPFFTTKPLGQGTGLGLSQVYGMARHAGGIARIASRPGRGTAVTLLLRRGAA